MGEKYKSVSEMVNKTSGDVTYKELFANQMKGKALGKFLFYLRCHNNLSQSELASKIGCSQGRISKIEHSPNKDLTIQDLLDYAKVLNLQLEIGYRHPSVKIVDLIKYHAFKIKTCLNQLSNIAEDDETLVQGVKSFCAEALFNIGRMIADNLVKLESKQKTQKVDPSTIHISIPLEKNKMEHVTKQVV